MPEITPPPVNQLRAQLYVRLATARSNRQALDDILTVMLTAMPKKAGRRIPIIDGETGSFVTRRENSAAKQNERNAIRNEVIEEMRQLITEAIGGER